MDPRYYLKRQLLFFVISLVALGAMSVFDYRKWEQLATILYVGIVVALLAVLSPVGSQALGSQRWFALGTAPAAAVRVRHPGADHRHRHLLCREDPRVSSSGTWYGWC